MLQVGARRARASSRSRALLDGRAARGRRPDGAAARPDADRRALRGRRGRRRPHPLCYVTRERAGARELLVLEARRADACPSARSSRERARRPGRPPRGARADGDRARRASRARSGMTVDEGRGRAAHPRVWLRAPAGLADRWQHGRRARCLPFAASLPLPTELRAAARTQLDRLVGALRDRRCYRRVNRDVAGRRKRTRRAVRCRRDIGAVPLDRPARRAERTEPAHDRLLLAQRPLAVRAQRGRPPAVPARDARAPDR